MIGVLAPLGLVIAWRRGHWLVLRSRRPLLIGLTAAYGSLAVVCVGLMEVLGHGC